MAEVTRRRMGELVQAVMRYLEGQLEPVPARVVVRAAGDAAGPTPFELGEYPTQPGVRRLDKIIRFATIGPVKAGWILKEQGMWSLTQEGREALRAYPNPEDLAREWQRLYTKWKSAQSEDKTVTETTEEVTLDTASATIEEAEEAAWQEISDYLHAMNPYMFQDLVGALLEAMGNHVAWKAPPGPDGGVDLIAFTDPLGVKLPRMKVQVKRRGGRVGAPEMRSFMAVLGDQDVGIFLALGGFTSEANAEARSQERRRLTLIDATRFFELWVEHYDRVPEAQRQLLPLRQVHYLAPRT